jgi:methionine synthase II (cobalamin-independent)
MKQKISKDILIEELVEAHPHLVAPLMDMGIVCLICGEAAWGTLEEQALDKGLDNIDEIVEKLNEIINA